jgi:hypothetical protein
MDTELKIWQELIDGIIWHEMHPDEQHYWLYVDDNRIEDYFADD